MRLSNAALAALPPEIERFGYDRDAQKIGIVHFGIGAFHRAHQAWYVDRAMQGGDRDWAIAGVSLRSDEVAQQINPQDGLYSVIERAAGRADMRLIGAVRQVHGPASGAAGVSAAIAAPDTRIVSLTVTEKGYCRAAGGGLDLALADRSFYPVLHSALAQRRAAGLPGLTLLSCDNLPDNGRVLEALVGDYLAAADPALQRWFETECACPSTMIDRIVPATTEVDRAEAAAALGCEDRAVVTTEPFSQWVIEDRFAGPRPRLEAVGAQLVTDVAPYETAKLRMLNGAHSALAYLGLERGHTFVHEAIADPALRPVIERLMRDEAASSLDPAPGQDLAAYADELLQRFANPALHHRLAQIAMDGSQKIPQRWLATLAALRAQGRTAPAILLGLGAWLRHLRGDTAPVNDPLAGALLQAWSAGNQRDAALGIVGPRGLLGGGWVPDEADLALLEQRIPG